METIIGFPDATPLLSDPQALRQTAAERGFLFFKGLLPREEVLELRRQILAIVREEGWLAEGTDALDGTVDPEKINSLTKEELAAAGVGIPRTTYEKIQCLEAFHRLSVHPNIIGLYEKLFGTEVLAHPRNISRVMLPVAGNHPTPPHQDWIHIQGTKNVWTCWFPLGDCPQELGGLSILDRSHLDGIRPVREASGAGGLETRTDDMPQCNWYQGDYEAGDIITFHSHNIHKSIPNVMKDQIRLSCDYRYQPANEPVEHASLRTHMGFLEWDEIYKHFSPEGEDLKYYWKNHDLEMVDFDDTIRAPGY